MLTIIVRRGSSILGARMARTINIRIPAALTIFLGLPILLASAFLADGVAIAAAGVTASEPGRTIRPHEAVALATPTEDVAVPDLLPHRWMENATSLGNGIFNFAHGELTSEDGGRDAFSFAATAGVSYIIDVECRMDIHDDGDVHYVEGYLVDPSILEVVNTAGEQVMAERDQGGYNSNWARGFFTPEEDGVYYIAVGSGHTHPSGTGHYTMTVRRDDHADDWRTNPEIAITPGETITATIDSDVSPDDPRLNPWDWLDWGDFSEPLWGVESLDDQDVFRFEIAREGTYRLSVSDERDELVVWSVWEDDGSRWYFAWAPPVSSVALRYQPGTYYVAVGTTFESEGNTGPYTLSLAEVDDESPEPVSP